MKAVVSLVAGAILAGSVPAASAGEVAKIGGSGSAMRSMEILADAFAKSHPAATITVVRGLGSRGSKRALLDGVLDIATGNFPPTAAERDQGLIAQEYATTPLVFATAEANPVSGLTLQELADIYSGKTFTWRERSREAFHRLLSERARISNTLFASVELDGVRADGGHFPVELSLSVWTEGAGNICYGAIIRDVSERKRVEAQLAAAPDEALRNSRLKSEFLATMSHEPDADERRDRDDGSPVLDTALSPNQRQYAETVRRSGEALLAIINDILDFSKIEAGRLEFEPVPFALRETVAGTLKTLALLAHAKGLELAYGSGPMCRTGWSATPAGWARSS